MSNLKATEEKSYLTLPTDPCNKFAEAKTKHKFSLQSAKATKSPAFKLDKTEQKDV